MVDQQKKFKKGSPNRDLGCGVLPVLRQQYSVLGTTSVAYLKNQGEEGGGGNPRFSQRHIMSVGREEGNDISSSSPSRTPKCVCGPSVTEGSESKPEHSRQDILFKY